MSAKLDIDYVEIKNFLSYGNYVTKFDVADKGPMLILGEVDENGTDTSNGAGKSSLVTAFIWCLFGRTISNRAPGDKIINWHSGKDCYVKVATTDGWEITRTRNIDGHSELMVSKDGEDKTKSTSVNAQKFLQETFGLDFDIFTSSVFCGQFGRSFLEMTSTKRKEAIERLLGVDKLNSYADLAKEKYKEVEKDQTTVRTRIELTQADLDRQQERIQEAERDQLEFEQSRTAQLERLEQQSVDIKGSILQIEVLDVENIKNQWATVDKTILEINGYRQEYNNNQSDINRAKASIAQAEQSYEAYELNAVEIDIDLEQLKAQHDLADRAAIKLSTYDQLFMQAQTDHHCLDRDVVELTERIEQWEALGDTRCLTCEQEIDGAHIDHTTEPLLIKLSEKTMALKTKDSEVCHLREIRIKLASVEHPNMTVEEAKRLVALNEQMAQDIEATNRHIEAGEREIARLTESNVELKKVIGQAVVNLEAIKPDVSLDEIQDYLVEIRSLKNRHDGIIEKIREVKTSKNPFAKIVQGLHEATKELKGEIDSLEDKTKQLDVLFAHYRYIYRSYSDRRKIKKWLLSELVPFLNNRVHYYLKALGIDIDISFNSTLDAKTDRWDYEFCSGGERKRMDLAIMFGLYDLYMSIYGKQCNIMVLDEVDSRLDRQSVEAFADVINDFNSDNSSYPRPSTILVISHKHELKDLIPSQVIIKKRNSFSVIDQT